MELEGVPAPCTKVEIRPKSLLSSDVRDAGRDRIETNVAHLETCFAAIFQALLVLSSWQVTVADTRFYYRT
jgi:hypothetical protein